MVTALRLPTIINSGKIMVIKDGLLEEEGTL